MKEDGNVKKEMRIKLIFAVLFVLVVLLFVGRVLAYGDFGLMGSSYGAGLFDTIMNDQNVQYMLIFLIFFGVIFFATKKAFRGETSVAMGISLALSLLIVLVFMRQGYLYDILGGAVGQIILFFAVLLAIAFLVRLSYVNLGKWMTAIILIILYPVIVFTNLGEWLPYGPILTYMEFVQSFLSGFLGIVLYIIAIIVLLAQHSPMERTLGRFFRRNG